MRVGFAKLGQRRERNSTWARHASDSRRSKTYHWIWSAKQSGAFQLQCTLSSARLLWRVPQSRQAANKQPDEPGTRREQPADEWLPANGAAFTDRWAYRRQPARSFR